MLQRHVMHKRYDTIKTILACEGIKRPADIQKLTFDENGYLSSSDYPWVKDLYDQFEDCSVAARTQFVLMRAYPGQYFRINRLNFIDKYHISKFSCFFPGRTIVSAGDIKKQEDVRYIQQFALFNFFFSDLIAENDMGFYTPNSVNGISLNSIISSSEEKYNISDLDKIGCHHMADRFQNPVVDMLYVGLPWLYNARIEDYIELINRYDAEFENYNRYISELAKTATSDIALTRDLVMNINDLRTEIQIGMEQKREELLKKGIHTFVGMCLTGIPYLVQLKYPSFDPALFSTLIGGKTLMDAADFIADGLKANRIPKSNPLWVIWKWSQVDKHIDSTRRGSLV